MSKKETNVGGWTLDDLRAQQQSRRELCGLFGDLAPQQSRQEQGDLFGPPWREIVVGLQPLVDTPLERAFKAAAESLGASGGPNPLADFSRVIDQAVMSMQSMGIGLSAAGLSAAGIATRMQTWLPGDPYPAPQPEPLPSGRFNNLDWEAP